MKKLLLLLVMLPTCVLIFGPRLIEWTGSHVGSRVGPNFNSDHGVEESHEARSEIEQIIFSHDSERVLEVRKRVEGNVGRYQSREFVYNFKPRFRRSVVWDLKLKREITRLADEPLVERDYPLQPLPLPDYAARLKRWGPWQVDPMRVDVRSLQFQKYSGDYLWEIDSWDFSPDGKLLAFGRPCMVDVWDSHGQRRLSVYKHAGYWPAVMFGPDSKTVVCFFGSNKPHAIDARTGKPVRYPRWVYRVFNKRGESLVPARFAFSPNGKLLAKAKEDERSIEIWTTPVRDAGRKLRTIRTSLLGIELLQFSPNGKTLAVGGVSASEIPVQFFDLSAIK